jgi:hypothetical protein
VTIFVFTKPQYTPGFLQLRCLAVPMPKCIPVLRRTSVVLVRPGQASICCCLAIAAQTNTPVLGRANFGLAVPENVSTNSPLVFASLFLSGRIVVASILHSTPAIRYCYYQQSDCLILIICTSVVGIHDIICIHFQTSYFFFIVININIGILSQLCCLFSIL